MIIWYQVYMPATHSVFGFAVKDGIIKNFPNHNMVGSLLTKHRTWFTGNNAQVVKICEQYEIS